MKRWSLHREIFSVVLFGCGVAGHTSVKNLTPSPLANFTTRSTRAQGLITEPSRGGSVFETITATSYGTQPNDSQTKQTESRRRGSELRRQLIGRKNSGQLTSVTVDPSRSEVRR